MPVIEKDILESAMNELHFMAHRNFGAARRERINWSDIDLKIESMNLALEEDDGISFRKNYFDLLGSLREKNEARREFGREPEDPRQLAPDGTRELLNHIVDKIICKLEEPQSSRENQPLKPNHKDQK